MTSIRLPKLLPLGRVLIKIPCRHFSPAATLTEAKYSIANPYKLHVLDSGPNTDFVVTREDSLRYYEQMNMIRKMEYTIGEMYKDGLVRGYCHLSIGEDAIAVGMKSAMDSDDHLITSYRCHGWSYMMGIPVNQILAEVTGRVGGNVFGKGGSMHMYASHFYGGNGIVGAQQAIGAGVALSIAYQKKAGACFTLFGEGAANQGQLYEVANMAKLMNLPCVFVCENNHYGMCTPDYKASADINFYHRMPWLPGIKADGMDVLTVRETTRFAKDWVKSQKGPLMLEFETYRYVGHSMTEPGVGYRKRSEVEQVRQTKDPIQHLRDEILLAKLATEEELEAILLKVKNSVAEAEKMARGEPELPPAALYTDVYKPTSGELAEVVIRGVTHEQQVKPKALTTQELIAHSKDAELRRYGGMARPYWPRK